MPKNLGHIESLARSYTDTAIKTLAGIMMEPTAPARARIAAAAILLDRGWGKPKETLVTEGSEDRGPLRIVREIVHVNETQEAIESEDLVVDFSEIKQINGNGSNGHRE